MRMFLREFLNMLNNLVYLIQAEIIYFVTIYNTFFNNGVNNGTV